MNLLKDPLTSFSNAATSIVGGLLTMLAALSFGTYLAEWFKLGEMPDLGLELFIYLPLSALGFIGLSCVQVWGLFYFAVLAVVFHRTIFGEASRWRNFVLVSVLQTIVTSLASYFLGTSHIDWALVSSVFLALCILAVLSYVVWRVRPRKK